jgi:hypothetical protein
VLAGICWLGLSIFFSAGPISELKKILGLTLTIGTGAAVFFLTALALRVSEVSEVVALLRRRFLASR